MSRTRRFLLIATVVMIVAIPTVALGSHQFTDVPDSNIFHNDIAWLAENGITRGCNPPANDKFCPESVVTRQTMAAFMRRLAEGRVVDAGRLQGYTAAQLMGGSGSTAAGAGDFFAWSDDPIILSHDVWTEVGRLEVTIPASGGVVNLSSMVAFEPPMGAAGGFAAVAQTLDDTCDGSTATTLGYADTANAYYDMATLVSAVGVSGGSHTIRTCVITEQLVITEKTLVTQSEIAVVWTPQSLGSVSLGGASIRTQSMDAAIAGMKERAETVRDSLGLNTSE